MTKLWPFSRKSDRAPDPENVATDLRIARKEEHLASLEAEIAAAAVDTKRSRVDAGLAIRQVKRVAQAAIEQTGESFGQAAGAIANRLANGQ